jgi:hypothetical protein
LQIYHLATLVSTYKPFRNGQSIQHASTSWWAVSARRGGVLPDRQFWGQCYDHHFRRKIGVFLKTQFYDPHFPQKAAFRVKKAISRRKYF